MYLRKGDFFKKNHTFRGLHVIWPFQTYSFNFFTFFGLFPLRAIQYNWKMWSPMHLGWWPEKVSFVPTSSFPPPFFGRQTHLRKSLFASMILIWIYFMRKKLVISICQKTPYTNVLLVKLYIDEQISYEFSIRLIQRLIIRLIRRLATVLVFCLISVCQILFYWFMALIHVGGVNRGRHNRVTL